MLYFCSESLVPCEFVGKDQHLVMSSAILGVLGLVSSADVIETIVVVTTDPSYFTYYCAILLSFSAEKLSCTLFHGSLPSKPCHACSNRFMCCTEGVLDRTSTFGTAINQSLDGATWPGHLQPLTCGFWMQPEHSWGHSAGQVASFDF